MNAQEAIEKIEQDLAQIDNLIDERNRLEWAGYISEEQRMEDEAEYNETKTALSIVLESAKLLHFLINEFDHDPGYRNFEIIDSDIYEHAADIYVDDLETLIVRSDVVGKIGIEKGADE